MADSDLWVLGINAYDHDVAACLLKNGEPVVAIAKERVTRKKHDTGSYKDPVDYCLATAGIELNDVHHIVRNCYILPVGELEERLAHHHQPNQLKRPDRERALGHPLFRSKDPRVVDISHHVAHAYSAFAASPFSTGAIMIVDGVGSYRCDVTEPLPADDDAPPLARESESYYRFDAEGIHPIRKVWLHPTKGMLSEEFINMDGLGAVYSRVSEYIFGDWNCCGEVMGLAPFGKLLDRPLMELRDGELVAHTWDGRFHRPYLGETDEEWLASNDRDHWSDVARQVQDDAERILVERARTLQQQTGAKHLCLAGGVALNCVANGRILDETAFESIYIQPAAGDDGIALGCALYGHLVLGKGDRPSEMRSAALGRTYDRFDEDEAFRPVAVRAATKRRKADDVCTEAAMLLSKGQVLGWFQGGSEFGPRALGHRSILADPRSAEIKDHVNARVKHRQGFRPFAPAVLAEHANEYFEGEAESPFMLLVRKVRPEKQAAVAGIVHVDGTARVQTVHKDRSPRFHALIEAFYKETGVPMLLNTSFNLRGEPIVEAPMDAVSCFLRCGMDALVIHDWMVQKSWFGRLKQRKR